MILLLLFSFISTAEVDPCTDLFGYACNQPTYELHDGTGVADPIQFQEKIKAKMVEYFPKYISELKAHYLLKPAEANKFARTLNTAFKGANCTANLACLDRNPNVRAYFANLFGQDLDINSILGLPAMDYETAGKINQIIWPGNQLIFSVRHHLDTVMQDEMGIGDSKVDVHSVFADVKKAAGEFLSANNANAITGKVLDIPLDTTDIMQASTLITGANGFSASYDEVKGSVFINGKGTYSMDSLYGIVFSLAHETCHSFDPCRFTEEPFFSLSGKGRENQFPFPQIIECLRDVNGGNAKTFADTYRDRADSVFGVQFSGESPEELADIKKFCKGLPTAGKYYAPYDMFGSLSVNRIKQIQAACPAQKAVCQAAIEMAETGGVPKKDACSLNDQIGEVFADWCATEIISRSIESISKKQFSEQQYRNGLANTFRKACPLAKEPETYFDVHAAIATRFRFQMVQPQNREKMKCGEDKSIGVLRYCTSGTAEIGPADAVKQ